MTDRPILFSAPMILALLAGRKTQTRRLLRMRGHKSFSEFGPSDTRGYDWHFRDAHMRWHDLRHDDLLARLPWQTGDRLWVRERWNLFALSRDYENSYPWTGKIPAEDPRDDPDGRVQTAVDYATAGLPGTDAGKGPWRSARYMPRWASRLTLFVTDVRVQRLQEISEADARAEGVALPPDHQSHRAPHRLEFANLWSGLHGQGAWEANPAVVALTFTAEKRNIDAAVPA